MRALLITAFAFVSLSVSGCSAQLTEEGEKVGLVTASTSSHCDLIKMFTVQGSDPDETLRIAFNEAATFGADSMAVASGRDNGSGSEINGVALKCRH